MNELVKIVLEHNKIPESQWWSHLGIEAEPFIPELVPASEVKALLQKHKQSKVLIWGDYDCDGLTGSVILYKYLKAAGFDVKPHLPMRHDGYSLNQKILQGYVDDGYTLVITVDCGVSSVDEITWLRSVGVDVLITDHHSLPESKLPPANIICHPLVSDVKGCEDFAGVGVAYSVVLKQCVSYGVPEGFDLQKWFGLVAIGTIGDVTKLLGHNRQLVKHAMNALRDRPPVGFAALMAAAEKHMEYMDEEMLAFQIIPRLNAAGRLSSPMRAFALLATEDHVAANKAAIELNTINTVRKQLSEQYLNKAKAQVDAFKKKPGAVVLKGDWQHGIIGITAAKVVETYGAPAFLCAQESGGILKGSARCPGWYSVVEGLRYAKDYLERFGGHQQAGGFTLKEENFDLFAKALQEHVAQWKKLDSVSELPISYPVHRLSEVDVLLALRMLKPIGAAFRLPDFKLDSVSLRYKRWSKDKKHLFFKAGTMNCVKWRTPYSRDLTQHDYADMVVSIGVSHFGDAPSVQLQVKQMFLPGTDQEIFHSMD